MSDDLFKVKKRIDQSIQNNRIFITDETPSEMIVMY